MDVSGAVATPPAGLPHWLAGALAVAVLAALVGLVMWRRGQAARRAAACTPELLDFVLQGLQGLTLQLHAISEELPAGAAAQGRLREVLLSADQLLALGVGLPRGGLLPGGAPAGLHVVAGVTDGSAPTLRAALARLEAAGRHRYTDATRDVVQDIVREALAGSRHGPRRLCFELLDLGIALCLRLHRCANDLATPGTATGGDPAACARHVAALARTLDGSSHVRDLGDAGLDLTISFPASRVRSRGRVARLIRRRRARDGGN